MVRVRLFDAPDFNYIMKVMLFAWDDLNVDHISMHEVTPKEAEIVIDSGEAPWPERKGDDKFVVCGPTAVGRMLQVIFVLKTPDEVEFEMLTIDEWADLHEHDRIIYVIHAMDMTAAMKRKYRKRRRP